MLTYYVGQTQCATFREARRIQRRYASHYRQHYPIVTLLDGEVIEKN